MPAEQLQSLTNATGVGTLACAAPHAGERRPAPISQSLPPHASHTFAVTYLRNSGDIFFSQRPLCHSAMDTEEVHRKAKPENNGGWADCSGRFALNRPNACATLHSLRSS
jgi:hypothetical protein